MTVVRLPVSNERRPTHGCGNCLFYEEDRSNASWSKCRAIPGEYARDARRKECDHGRLWEPMPPPVPVLVRFKRWLIG
jgi:hypothetical protein